MYSDADMTTELTLDGLYYVVDNTDSVYAKNTTEHELNDVSSFDLTVVYSILDTQGTETDTADMPVMPCCFWVLVVAKSSLNIYDSLLPEPLRSRSSSNMAPSSLPFIFLAGFAGDDEASTRSSLPLSWEPDFPP